MKNKVFISLLLLFPILVYSQSAPQPYGALPSAAQLRWQETEMYCIIHFGVNTYLDHEWGYGDEDPALINPVSFNAEQIVGAAKAGGFRGIVVVAKHHDGLCLWPSRTTDHTIARSPWRGGKGDMVQEYKRACDKLGIRLGLYCSPWDRNNPEYGKAGYLSIYREQLKELYSRYGSLFMSWHDGANGGSGYYGGARETRNIDRTTYYDWDSTWGITRVMQPGAAIFGDVGPDVRWVGNEEGHAGVTSWATYTPHAPEAGRKPANGYVKSEEATEGTRDGQYWMPAECDVPLRPGWFYHASQDAQVKTPAQLLDLYYASVGRGAGLDLGLSPDKRGLLNDADVAALKGFGDLLRATFAVNLAKGARFKASNVRAGNGMRFGPGLLTDEDRYNYWATDDSVRTPQVEMDLGVKKTFNVIRLRENIKLGQRVGAYAIDAMVGGQWQEIAAGTSIGGNRLIRLGNDVTTTRLRLRITESAACVALSDWGLFREPVRQAAPVIRRDRNGMVSIMLSKKLPAGSAIRYTTNGLAPTPKSAVYQKPFALTDGGTVRAACFTAVGLPGDIGTEVYGIPQQGWDVISAPDGSEGELAIDGDDGTEWNSTVSNANEALPAAIEVDMSRPQLITGFTYLPRTPKEGVIPGEGLIDRWSFYTSNDGTHWTIAGKGEYNNIAANPVKQLAMLGTPVTARYFKFVGEHVIAGKGVRVAELGIVSK